MMKAPVAHDGYGRVAKRLLGWAMLPVGLVLLCMAPQFVMLWDHRDQKADRARLDMRNIHQTLEAYRAQAGAWPPEESWMRALIDARLLASEPLDPWDRPYRYRFGAPDAQPVLTSLGRDGEFGTGDDILERKPEGPR